MNRVKTVLLVGAIAIVVLGALVWWESGWKCVRTSQRLEVDGGSGATGWRTVCVELAPKSRGPDSGTTSRQ
ncbi:MAG: hypothetical protein DMD81_01525 [Candidatus Rokuibacteriota bacterium]|nr:MAG: hypothetical protein DMD81_01525 [Candidatus Rokubacteria bacterium]